MSKPCWTEIGVLAGCPVAMATLCLAVIDAVDKFMDMKPEALEAMKVYVDDFTATFRFPKGTDPKKAAGCVAFNMRRLHKYLEEEGLILAPSKSKVLCSCEETGRECEKALNAETEIEIGPGPSGMQLENKTGKVISVKEGSNAYEAGIRAG